MYTDKKNRTHLFLLLTLIFSNSIMSMDNSPNESNRNKEEFLPGFENFIIKATGSTQERAYQTQVLLQVMNGAIMCQYQFKKSKKKEKPSFPFSNIINLKKIVLKKDDKLVISQIVQPFGLISYLMHNGTPGQYLFPTCIKQTDFLCDTLLDLLPPLIQKNILVFLLINTQMMLDMPKELLYSKEGAALLKERKFTEQFANFSYTPFHILTNDYALSNPDKLLTTYKRLKSSSEKFIKDLKPNKEHVSIPIAKLFDENPEEIMKSLNINLKTK